MSQISSEPPPSRDLPERSDLSLVTITELDESGISDEALLIFNWAIFGVLCQIIGIFGIVTNIINIICFIKQDFKDSVNVSLLGLAISDLLCLVPLVGLNIVYTPAVFTSDLPMQAMEVCYLMFVIPHMTFTRVSSWITAVITLERCLCITAPLKIKSLISSKKMFVVIISIYIILLFSTAPTYAVNSLEMDFSPERNKTILVRVSTSNREHVESISYIINNFTIPLFAFVVIVVCTVILVAKLQKTAQWRQKSTACNKADSISSRNQKVAKMVVTVSCLFITCFAPVGMLFLVVAFQPALSYGGKYLKIGLILGALGFFLESVNSSVNIFIYYHMSSKYRDTFRNIFVVITLGNKSKRNV